MAVMLAKSGYSFARNANVSDAPATSRSFKFSLYDSGDALLAYGAKLDRTGTPEDEATVANPDSYSLPENSTITANVMDNDVNSGGGPTETVTSVNGNAAAIGTGITLASGAKLTLNADGSYAYDPAGASNLVATGSGAPTGTTDSFTYELSGGGGATVQITVNGVDEADDERSGTVGDDTLTGSTGDDTFILNQSNDPSDNDTVSGNDGDDRFFMQNSFDINDALDGGNGTDTLLLQGNYFFPDINGQMLTGFERIEVMSGSDNRFGTGSPTPYFYDLILADSVVAVGQRLTIDGSGLGASESLTVGGEAETDGSFAIYGGAGYDYLVGGAQADFFAPGSGTDLILAQDGIDAIYMGGNLEPDDYVDGGGSNDILGLQGNYANYTFGADNLRSIEILALLSGSFTQYSGGPGTERYDYDLTTPTGNLPSGSTLVVHAGQLLVGEDLRFNGSAELLRNFFIYSGAGDDTLIGGLASDTFVPSTGSDSMTGGGGNDLFYYRFTDESPASSPDSITDFTAGDRVAVYGLGVPGGLGIRFIGEEGFSNRAGELRVTGSGTDWLVEIDVDGDGDADFAIDVTTTASGYGWSAGDFVF